MQLCRPTEHAIADRLIHQEPSQFKVAKNNLLRGAEHHVTDALHNEYIGVSLYLDSQGLLTNAPKVCSGASRHRQGSATTSIDFYHFAAGFSFLPRCSAFLQPQNTNVALTYKPLPAN